MTQDTTPTPPKESGASRRKFIGAAAGTAAVASTLPIEGYAQVGGSDQIKVGMIGIGGRNSGAIIQNLNASDSAICVAVADAFQDKIDGTGPRAKGLPVIQKQLEKMGKSAQFDVPESRQFAGFDAYKQVIDEVDVVCIATPPGFRPHHFEYAVQQGKHVFMEKPLCVDAWGYNKVIEAAKMADEKNLKVCVGLQRHYQNSYRAAFDKVRGEGLIGDITGAQVWWNGTRPWIVERQPGWTEMEYQMRNWYHFAWLCGDHIAEQHVHNLDVANWFISGDSEKGGNPVSCQGMGGRAGTEPASVGEIFDHHYVEYRFAESNAVVNSQCRHIQGTFRKVAEEIHGSEGIAYLGNGSAKLVDRSGKEIWTYRKPRIDDNPYDVEHAEFHKAIREDLPMNNAYYGAKSSYMSSLGRIATYTGQEVNWDESIASNFKIGPDTFAMDGEPPVKPNADGDYQIAIPGKTPLPWA